MIAYFHKMKFYVVSIELTAAEGYDTYVWSTSPSGIPVIGSTQTISVTETGKSYTIQV